MNGNEIIITIAVIVTEEGVAVCIGTHMTSYESLLNKISKLRKSEFMPEYTHILFVGDSVQLLRFSSAPIALALALSLFLSPNPIFHVSKTKFSCIISAPFLSILRARRLGTLAGGNERQKGGDDASTPLSVK